MFGLEMTTVQVRVDYGSSPFGHGSSPWGYGSSPCEVKNVVFLELGALLDQDTEVEEQATKFADQEVPLKCTIELTENITFIDNYPLVVENHEADAEEENTEKALTNAEWDALLLEFDCEELRSTPVVMGNDMDFELYLLEFEGEQAGGLVNENHVAVAWRNAGGACCATVSA